MPSTHARIYSRDEELGKRDDDFRPRKSPASSTLLQPWKWRKRRLAAALAVVLFVYVFVHNIPTDLGSWDTRVPLEYRPKVVQEWREQATRPQPAQMQQPGGSPPAPAKGNAPPNGDTTNGEHYYAGPIRFFKLRDTLTSIGRTSGSRPINRNVLFAASSLKSAANLLPMACEMASWDRNYVHFVLMGRETLEVKDVLAVNGIDTDACPLYFHDARPDYGEYSTDLRAEVSVAGAMGHIQEYMHPQAIITDDSLVEDGFFIRAIRRKARQYDRAAIEIPTGRYEDFLWITMLNAESLSNWFRPNIDILIQAPEGSSGSLIRLLKSLELADYAGLRVPRLTIELPSKIESFAQRYLEDIVWPPIGDNSPIKQSTLTVRHRIPSTRLSSEQTSLRFLEGYYPLDPNNHHVLVLSPQAELSPIYLQYLHYQILEHRYSSYATIQGEDLLGLSLDVPATSLNGSVDFVIPKVRDMLVHKDKKNGKLDEDEHTSFLYQAPSSTASLIFGDKWATFHDFLSNRLLVAHLGNVKKSPKLVSETEPAWVEFLLELMRARGWSMLHPAESLATIHNDLAQVPEEFIKDKKPQQEDDFNGRSDHTDEEIFLTADTTPVLKPHLESEPVPGRSSLQDALQLHGDIPELSRLPYLSHTGELITSTSMLVEMVQRYVPFFRGQSGGCDEKNALLNRNMRLMQTDDLFCLPGVDLEVQAAEAAEALDDIKDAEVAQAIAGASALPIDAAASAASAFATVTPTSVTLPASEISGVVPSPARVTKAETGDEDDTTKNVEI